METDNGANCEVLSPVMEDERVSTVASTAPDRNLLLSANHVHAPAPRYRPPPPYNPPPRDSNSQIRSSISKSSINRTAYRGTSEDDYAEYDDEDHENGSFFQQRQLPYSQDTGDQIYYAHEYTPRRQLESNGTMRSTTTINSIRHNDSLNRLHQQNNPTRECGT